MNKLDKEQLSAVIDGEHIDEQFLDRLLQDKEMQQTWSRYHLIGDCLRDNVPEQISFCIAESVSRALEDEPTILAPKKKYFGFKSVVGFAVAATVAMLAVFTIQADQQVISSSGSGATVASNHGFNLPPSQTSSAVKYTDTPKLITNECVDDSHIYRSNAGMNSITPYVRVMTIKPQQ